VTGNPPERRLYDIAKRSAMDRLGGERAYWIQGPSIRRLAVADAVLTTLALQDEDAVTDAAVRRMLTAQFDLLTSDTDFYG
jgi:hypothetical protein